jgi:hypothetical protein
MFRGALILGIGFSLGYSHAIRTSPDLVKALGELTDVLKQVIEDKDIDQPENKEDVIEGQTVETPTGEGE